MSVRRALAIAGSLALLTTGGGQLAAQETTPLPPGALSNLGPSNFSAAARDEIGTIVRDYLLANPDVMIEILQNMQRQQEQSQLQSRRQQGGGNAVAANADALYNAENDPTAGNPAASVTVVEFFDYHCPFCKRISTSVAELTKNDDDVRVVFKEFPVFGEDSVFAARAALASKNQGLYEAFHLALMGNRGRLNERVVMRHAERVGLDVDQLRQDMEAPEVEATIQANYRLAQALGIRDTPGFIIGDEIIPGALDLRTMRRLVRAQRRS